MAHFLVDALPSWSLDSLADALPLWSLGLLADACRRCYWMLVLWVDALPP
jgi:hypothetical protein